MTADLRESDAGTDAFDAILARVAEVRSQTDQRIAALSESARPLSRSVPTSAVEPASEPQTGPPAPPLPAPAVIGAEGLGASRARASAGALIARSRATTGAVLGAIPTTLTRTQRATRTTLTATGDPRRTRRLSRQPLAALLAVVGLVLIAAIAARSGSFALSTDGWTSTRSLPDPGTAVAPVIPPAAPAAAAPSEPEPEPERTVRRIPLAVRIPTIGVDARTVPVGLELDGSMEIPSDVATIGWYEPGIGVGVTPGEPGTAVLAGHVDSRTQGAGAFYFLRDLAVGDVIEIEHADDVSRWIITSVRQYAKDELPIPEIFIRTGSPRLALITCGGPFDWTERSYTDNLVVYAEPLASASASSPGAAVGG
jgi:hypothetical protein